MLICFLITAYNLYSIDMYVFIGLKKHQRALHHSRPHKKVGRGQLFTDGCRLLGATWAGRQGGPRVRNAQMIGMIGSPV